MKREVKHKTRMSLISRRRINSYLDRIACPQVHLLHLAWSAFQACGVGGLAIAILLTGVLAKLLGLTLWVIAVIALSAVMTFFALVLATKIITGEEKLIYYHHEIAVMASSILLLWLLQQPILLYLDLTILGVGIFLACGRFGCFMVGCCHGRPHFWGVLYGNRHAEAGFTPYFVGIRLFPIQLVESLYVLGVVIIGSILVLNGLQPGTALAWYVVTYDLGRFFFEFLRGDPDRPYYLGFSQPQWISLTLMLIVLWLETIEVLPFALWHFGATAWVGVTMIAVTLHRYYRKTPKHLLLHPQHVREVAQALISLSIAVETGKGLDYAAIPISCTSQGVQISMSQLPHNRGRVEHYALSSRFSTMTQETARTLSALIVLLKQFNGSTELIEGSRGIYHLLIHSDLERRQCQVELKH